MEPAAPLNDTCSHQGPTSPDVSHALVNRGLSSSCGLIFSHECLPSLHADGLNGCEANLRSVCSLAVGAGPVTVHTAACASFHVHFPRASLDTSSHHLCDFTDLESLVLTFRPHCIQLVPPSSRQCSSTAPVNATGDGAAAIYQNLPCTMMLLTVQLPHCPARKAYADSSMPSHLPACQTGSRAGPQPS